MAAISEWMFWMDVLIFAYVLYAFWYERPSTRNSLHFFIPLTFPYIVWCLCGSRFSQSVKYVLKVILLYFILSLLFPYHIHIFYGKLNENGDISSSIPTGRKWKQKTTSLWISLWMDASSQWMLGWSIPEDVATICAAQNVSYTGIEQFRPLWKGNQSNNGWSGWKADFTLHVGVRKPLFKNKFESSKWLLAAS